MPVLFIPWLIFSVLYKFEMPAGVGPPQNVRTVQKSPYVGN